MIDKIVNTKDNSYYILDETDYKGKKYVFATIKDKENIFLVLEVKIKNNVLYLDNINDIELKSTVNNIFLKRISEI